MRKIVKPARKGLVVMDEYGRRVPDEGANVEWNEHTWGFYLREGSIIVEDLVEERTAPSTKKKKPSTGDKAE